MKSSIKIVVAVLTISLFSGCTSMSHVERAGMQRTPPRSVERSMQFTDRLNSYRSPNHETGKVLRGGCTGTSTQDGDVWSCEGGTTWDERAVSGGGQK